MRILVSTLKYFIVRIVHNCMLLYSDQYLAINTGGQYVIISAVVSICFLLIIAIEVVILVLLFTCQRRRVKSGLTVNGTYKLNECEIKATKSVITATNAVSAAASNVPSPSGENDVDITTSTNEAYTSTDITTSVNAAYKPVKNSTLQYDYVIVPVRKYK